MSIGHFQGWRNHTFDERQLGDIVDCRHIGWNNHQLRIGGPAEIAQGLNLFVAQGYLGTVKIHKRFVRAETPSAFRISA